MQTTMDIGKAKQILENLYGICNILRNYQYRLRELSIEMSASDDESQQEVVRRLNRILDRYEERLHQLRIMIQILEKCISVYQKTEKEVTNLLEEADKQEWPFGVIWPSWPFKPGFIPMRWIKHKETLIPSIEIVAQGFIDMTLVY